MNHNDQDHRIISDLVHVVAKLERAVIEALPLLATKQDLTKTETKIMSAISDFATQVTAFNDRIDAAITNLQGDVDNLEKQIAALQNSPGTITPADQALLDGIQARAAAVADKLDALDALTPPAAPPAV